MEDVDSLIKTIIHDKFKLNVLNSTLISSFVEDSMAKIEMLFEVEQALKIKIDEEELLSIESVDDIIRAAKKELKKSEVK